MMEPIVPVVINTPWTQPVDSEGNVILVPPGSINVSGDDEKLFAVRITEEGQTATLNGTILSKGTGSYTYGLLFQNDSSLDLSGNIQFYTGKAKMEVIGSDIATGISGSALLIAGKEGAPLSGSLKVSAKSDGASPQASGIFAWTIDIQSELAMNINVNTEAENEFGFATTYGIGGFLGLQLDGFSDKFRLTAQASSAMNADSYGIYGDTTIDGMLAGKIVVKAEGLYGDGANAYGLSGQVVTQSVSNNFKLEVESESKTGYASSYGFYGDFSANEELTGKVTIKAGTAEGLYSMAVGFGSVSGVSGVSDQFKLNVEAQGGWSQAIASGVSGTFFTCGTLSGTFTVKADGCNIEPPYEPYGTEAYGFNGAVSAEEISDKFKLDVTAKAKYELAKAYGFASTLYVGSPDTLGGTVSVKAETSGEADAEAYGVADTLTAPTVSDKFKLTVTAKSDAGTAIAQGFAATDIESGLAGKISVTAESKSGLVMASGARVPDPCSLTIRTLANSQFEVVAKTKGDALSVAFGFSLEGQDASNMDIDLAGRLVVIAQSNNLSGAYGVSAGNGSLTGTISGVICAIGGSGTGVFANASSNLTVSGGVYAGTKGNANDIARYLENRVGTGRNASGKNKNTALAVSLGDGSTLTLTDGAIVIGDVALGDCSTLNLSTGSQLYGDIDMESSGELNFTIDGTLSNAAVVTLDSAGAGVFAEDSGVNLTVTATEISQTGKYVLLAGSDLSELQGVDFDTLFDLVDFDTYGLDASWELDLSGKTDTLTLVLSDAPVGFSANLLSAMDLNSADRMLASSSLTDELATSSANVLKNALVA